MLSHTNCLSINCVDDGLDVVLPPFLFRQHSGGEKRKMRVAAIGKVLLQQTLERERESLLQSGTFRRESLGRALLLPHSTCSTSQGSSFSGYAENRVLLSKFPEIFLLGQYITAHSKHMRWVGWRAHWWCVQILCELSIIVMLAKL